MTVAASVETPHERNKKSPPIDWKITPPTRAPNPNPVKWRPVILLRIKRRGGRQRSSFEMGFHHVYRWHFYNCWIFFFSRTDGSSLLRHVVNMRRIAETNRRWATTYLNAPTPRSKACVIAIVECSSPFGDIFAVYEQMTTHVNPQVIPRREAITSNCQELEIKADPAVRTWSKIRGGWVSSIVWQRSTTEQ